MNIQRYQKHFQFLRQRKNKGFTLNELIIVVAITGVIPAIVMPVVWNHYNTQQQIRID